MLFMGAQAQWLRTLIKRYCHPHLPGDQPICLLAAVTPLKQQQLHLEFVLCPVSPLSREAETGRQV